MPLLSRPRWALGLAAVGGLTACAMPFAPQGLPFASQRPPLATAAALPPLSGYHALALAVPGAPHPPALVVPPVATPAPGPAVPGGASAVGLVRNNGAPASGIKLTIVQAGGHLAVPVTTDAQGVYRADKLPAGLYYAAYYNPSDRNKIGYWHSRPVAIDALHGAAFPMVDLYLKGLLNTPAMNTHVALPTAFQWLGPLQPVVSYSFRVHSQPFTSFQLIYQSPKLDPTSTGYAWDGSRLLVGLKLDPLHRYFWGVKWDWGPLGEGGNLYQPLYMQAP